MPPEIIILPVMTAFIHLFTYIIDNPDTPFAWERQIIACEAEFHGIRATVIKEHVTCPKCKASAAFKKHKNPQISEVHFVHEEMKLRNDLDERWSTLRNAFDEFRPPREMGGADAANRRDLQAMLDFAVEHFGVRNLAFMIGDAVREVSKNYREEYRDDPDLLSYLELADRWCAFLIALGRGHTDVSLGSADIDNFVRSQRVEEERSIKFRDEVLGKVKTKISKRKS